MPHAMKSSLPLGCLTRASSAEDTVVPLPSPLDDDPLVVGFKRRWSERNALAFAKSLTVSLAQAKGVSVT